MLLTTGSFLVGFLVVVEVEAKFSNTGVPVAEAPTAFVADSSEFDVECETVKLNLPHPTSKLPVPHTELLFTEPDEVWSAQWDFQVVQSIGAYMILSMSRMSRKK